MYHKCTSASERSQCKKHCITPIIDAEEKEKYGSPHPGYQGGERTRWKVEQMKHRKFFMQ
jgi:hypothetical protein